MDQGTLHNSKWAPSSSRVLIIKDQQQHNSKNGVHHTNHSTKPTKPPTTTTTAIQRAQLSQIHDYERFARLLRRLKWKSTTLLFCHTRAMTQSTDNVINNQNFPISSDTGKANAAEIMFKVDFFEFYALLERVLVHLLGCFGMVITAEHHHHQHNTSVTKDSILGDSRAIYGYAHRFHANVLAALDLDTNPLHAVLGTGKVRQYLGLAKEFRNRWKEVEIELEAQNGESPQDRDPLAGLHRNYHQILIDLKLDEMLATLLSALDQARALAYEHLPSSTKSVEVNMLHDVDGNHVLAEDMMMDDAMEWD